MQMLQKNMEYSTLMPIRQLTLKDTAELYALIEISRQDLTNLEWSKGATFESTARFIGSQGKNNRHYASIFNGNIVGLIGLWDLGDFQSVGYWLGTPFRGRGLMVVALKYFLYTTEVNGLKEVRARAKKSNEKSIKTLVSCGFKKINDFKEKDEDWTMFGWKRPQ